MKKLLIPLLLLTLLALASFHLTRFTLADIYASMGKKQYSAKEYEHARTHLARSLHFAPGNADYHYSFAEVLYALAKKEKTAPASFDLLQQAKKAYKKSRELNPLEGNPWYGLAQTHWWLSRFKGSEKEKQKVENYFKKALATDPNNGKFLYGVVNFCLSTSSPEKCSKELKQLAIVYPNAYNSLKRHPNWYEDASAFFMQGLEIAAENPIVEQRALSLLASIFAKKKDWEMAAFYQEELIRRSGRKPSPSIFANLGYYSLKGKKIAKAKEAFLEALKLSDRPDRTLQGLIGRFRKAHALDLYIEICQETAKLDRTVKTRLPILLGKAYLYQDNLDEAALNFQRSLKRKETAEAHGYLAEIAFKKKDWDQSELESQRATVLDPENSHYYVLFVRSLQKQKKYESALEAIEKAIKKAPSPRHYYHNTQGWLYWAMMDYRQAIKSWKTANRLVPKNVHYLRQIAIAYEKIEDWVQAETYYQKALQLRPNDAQSKKALAALVEKRKTKQ